MCCVCCACSKRNTGDLAGEQRKQRRRAKKATHAIEAKAAAKARARQTLLKKVCGVVTTVEVCVVEARGLAVADASTSDPFAVVEFVDLSKKDNRSKNGDNLSKDGGDGLLSKDDDDLKKEEELTAAAAVPSSSFRRKSSLKAITTAVTAAKFISSAALGGGENSFLLPPINPLPPPAEAVAATLVSSVAMPSSSSSKSSSWFGGGGGKANGKPQKFSLKTKTVFKNLDPVWGEVPPSMLDADSHVNNGDGGSSRGEVAGGGGGGGGGGNGNDTTWTFLSLGDEVAAAAAALGRGPTSTTNSATTTAAAAAPSPDDAASAANSGAGGVAPALAAPAAVAAKHPFVVSDPSTLGLQVQVFDADVFTSSTSLGAFVVPLFGEGSNSIGSSSSISSISSSVCTGNIENGLEDGVTIVVRGQGSGGDKSGESADQWYPLKQAGGKVTAQGEVRLFLRVTQTTAVPHFLAAAASFPEASSASSSSSSLATSSSAVGASSKAEADSGGGCGGGAAATGAGGDADEDNLEQLTGPSAIHLKAAVAASDFPLELELEALLALHRSVFSGYGRDFFSSFLSLCFAQSIRIHFPFFLTAINN